MGKHKNRNKGKMKFTCKLCHEHFKVDSTKEVKCDRENCEVKYHIHGERLAFKDFKWLTREPLFIVAITSPTTVVKHKEFTVAEWEEYLRQNGDGLIPF